jgi:predicted  nucleic acid-binding Zn-ribbon protein
LPTTPKLPLKLHERLGDDAMTELLTLFGEHGAETRAEFHELREADARLEARVAALEKRMEAGFADVKQQIGDVRQQITDLKPHIAGVQAELIKWTFLFWLGTIGIVLLLIRFPR